MRIGVISLFPAMFDAVSQFGITGRAVEKNILQLEFWNPRDFTADRHRTVDDRPYGGGPGMVMMTPPLQAAMNEARKALGEQTKRVYLSPQGRPLTQQAVKELASNESLILIAGRYEGIDERFLESEVDEEWSIGDYVLSGGELGAMVMIDAMARLLPGALGHQDSAEQDSFSDGLLDCPHYTRPETIDGMKVPAVLLSGDHQKIAQWRLKQSIGRTWLRRPDLLKERSLNELEQRLLDEFIKESDQG